MAEAGLYILDDDKQWLTHRIDELEKEIQALGPDFYDVFNQSSETWHDNAPFDALRDKQSVLFAEYSNLKVIRHKAHALPTKCKRGTVGIGSQVTLSGKQFMIAGDWTYRAGQKQQDGTVVISSQTPLAQAIIGQKAGYASKFGTIESTSNRGTHE